MGSLGEKEMQNAINEVRIIASIKHPCVSSYKEAFTDESSHSLWYVNDFFLATVIIFLAPLTLEDL
jgi:NIMA (never in mitosis gene a)-related kinase 1/4/5